MLILWAVINLPAQSSNFKKISFSNFDINQVHVSPQVGKQIKDGKLIINIPKGTDAPKVILDLYADDSVLNLTVQPVINIKAKSAYGTFLRLFPIDGSGATQPDTGITNRQKIRCSSAFQWLHHQLINDTLSNGQHFDHITQLGIAPDFAMAASQDLVLEIDSILLGDVGYTPLLPTYAVPEGKVWTLNNLQGYESFGTDYAEVVNDGLQLHFSETRPSFKGIRFNISTGSGDDSYIDINTYPIVVVGFKGASNDTLRANLITSPPSTVISNLAYQKINGDGTTSIDFSSLSSLYSFDKIATIQLLLNPSNSSTGTFTITSLEAGMGAPPENCSGTIGILDSKVADKQTVAYPNPANTDEQLTVEPTADWVEFRSLNDTHMATVEVQSGHVQIPDGLTPGLYILKIASVQGTSYTKLQIK